MDAPLPAEKPLFHFRDQSWFTCINAPPVSLEEWIALKDVGQAISLAQHFSMCLLQSGVWQWQCHSKCLADAFIWKSLGATVGTGMRRALIHCGPLVKYSPYITRGLKTVNAREESPLRSAAYPWGFSPRRLQTPFVSRSSSAVRESPSNLRRKKKKKWKDVMTSTVNVNCT